eukprot:scpid63327/ scgid28443/ Beta-1,3-galactosyltransferase 1; UDP-Gal:betaGlcNAc beta 1,3-galactosyltransferase-I; UDP-galactose:beta-N-acetyl-glucosamine-beta-1,3-galactosyltransferase 1 &gt; Beta-1,3-galactosyltransferase 1; UDP-galactose:beta-N-acetyl-glucosamine-beta-1,3-galactosyltransferase 1 &gt; Beta-1,3-galactosyltransferase 1; UDP-galactose:beta-N-acetyl-glucosamine-beta-1,3-galactosyltransferase 1 &gt; Beta-1,3-galactosyltransferase 1; UDP-galactose:beta-N-acetyl-glucosamine-beta-1,3-gala
MAKPRNGVRLLLLMFGTQAVLLCFFALTRSRFMAGLQAMVSFDGQMCQEVPKLELHGRIRTSSDSDYDSSNNNFAETGTWNWRPPPGLTDTQERFSGYAKSSVSILIMVKSGPAYFQERALLRSLWFNKCATAGLWHPSRMMKIEEQNGPSQAAVKCLFMTGRSTNATITEKLQHESLKNNDMVVGPFWDSYDKMLGKTLWSLYWSRLRSERFDYVMLVDDDAYVVFRYLIPWLNGQERTRFYAGHEHLSTYIIYCEKHPKSKNCVGSDKLKGLSEYPRFPSGFAYIMSHDVVEDGLHQALLRISEGLPGNVEDAMVSLLVKSTGVQLKHTPGFVNWFDLAGCPSNSTVLVAGNAPRDALVKMNRNDMARRNICDFT